MAVAIMSRGRGMEIGAAETAGLGATITAIVSFLVGWRLTRGSVSTSNAGQLWKELNEARKDAQKEASELRAEIRLLREDIRERDQTVEALQGENRKLRRQVALLEAEVARLIEQVPESQRMPRTVMLMEDEGIE